MYKLRVTASGQPAACCCRRAAWRPRHRPAGAAPRQHAPPRPADLRRSDASACSSASAVSKEHTCAGNDSSLSHGKQTPTPAAGERVREAHSPALKPRQELLFLAVHRIVQCLQRSPSRRRLGRGEAPSNLLPPSAHGRDLSLQASQEGMQRKMAALVSKLTPASSDACHAPARQPQPQDQRLTGFGLTGLG